MDEQKQATAQIAKVPFNGGVLELLRGSGNDWLAVKPACEAIGLDFSAQRNRLQRQKWATVAIMTTVGGDGKDREMYCLRADIAPMWLATLDAGRIKDPEVRSRIELWQVHATAALSAYARGEQAPAASDQVTALLLEEIRASREERQGMRELCAKTIALAERVTQLVENLPGQIADLAASLKGDNNQTRTAPTRALTRPEPASARQLDLLPSPSAQSASPPPAAPLAPAKEQYMGTGQMAARLGMTTKQWQHFVGDQFEFRKLQRSDNKWPVNKTVATYRNRQELIRRWREEEDAAQAKREAEEMRQADITNRAEIAGRVKAAAETHHLGPKGEARIWQYLYQRFTTEQGYDPRDVAKQEGKDPLDVVFERGHMGALMWRFISFQPSDLFGF